MRSYDLSGRKVRLVFPRSLRGSARIVALYGAAGVAYFPIAHAALRFLGGDAPGLTYLDTLTDVGFVGVTALLLRGMIDKQRLQMRRVNERLEASLAASTDDLRREVAERARAEAALRDSEQRFHDITEVASDWVWEMGPDLRFTYASTRFTDVTGIPAAELTGRPAAELFDSALSAQGALHGNWLMAQRPFREVTVILRTRGGGSRQLTLSGRPVFDSAGAFCGYRGTGSDVTEQRSMEISAQRLRHSQELILNSLGEGVFGLDRDGRVTFANPAAQDMLGWAAVELIGRIGQEILQPNPSVGLGPSALGERSRRRVAARFRRKDGSSLPVDYVWTAVVENGQTSGAVVAFRDVTEQQRAEAELIAAKERAEAATRTKSEFLAHMSHELRTPLNSIMGFADVMLGEYFGPVGNERYRDYVADIRRSGEHLLGLISDVVDLARIEAGKLVLDEKPTDMAALVEEAMTMIRPLASQSGCSLLNNVPGNLPKVMVDPRRIKQLLLNLLTNAVTFTPKDGRVAVLAEVEADGALILRVSDTGLGIPAEELPKVTQVFIQGNNAVAREKGGAGLGLPLAKQLIELHGGRMQIDSEPSKGTTVTLRLPPGRLISGGPLADQPAAVEYVGD